MCEMKVGPSEPRGVLGQLPFCGRKFKRLSLLCLEAKQGVEFDTDWLLCEIPREHLTQAATKVSLELSVAESYPETVNIDWTNYDTATAIRELDPVSWERLLASRSNPKFTTEIWSFLKTVQINIGSSISSASSRHLQQTAKVLRTKCSRKAVLVASPAQLPYGELRRHFSVNQETEELVASETFPFFGVACKRLCPAPANSDMFSEKS